MSDVGNMYPHLPITVWEFCAMQSIVDIFASRWVNGKDGDMTKVSTARLKFNFVVRRRKAGQNLKN
jgi:hypothetical protein